MAWADDMKPRGSTLLGRQGGVSTPKQRGRRLSISAMKFGRNQIVRILAGATTLIFVIFLSSLGRQGLPQERARDFTSNFVTSTSLSPDSACMGVPNAHIQRLHAVQEATARVFVDGKAIQISTKITPPKAICILVAIPQMPRAKYPDLPIPGKGPDTIHLFLNSSTTSLTFPPLRPLPGQEGITRQTSSKPIIYYVDPIITTNGVYQIAAEQEFANWRWAQEWTVSKNEKSFTYRSGESVYPLDAAGDHSFRPLALESTDIHPPTLLVDGPSQLPERPVCNDQTTAIRGKWIKLNESSTVLKDLADDFGYVWDGDDCKLDAFDAREIITCLTQTTIHVYGDADMRRLAKTIVSGNTWCQNATDYCQLNDDGEKTTAERAFIWKDEVTTNSDLRNDVFSIDGYNRPHTDFGSYSRLHFSSVPSVVNGSATWMSALLEEKDKSALQKLTPNDKGSEITSRARPPPSWGRASVVIVGIGGGDQSNTESFARYEEWLPRFRASILAAYPDTPIVVRLSNSFCCRGPSKVWQRFSGSRVQHFDDITRRVFRVQGSKGMGGRVTILDPSNMNGRPGVAFDSVSPGDNDPRSSHPRMENQMLLNSLCQRDTDGTVRFRNNLMPQAAQGTSQEEVTSGAS